VLIGLAIVGVFAMDAAPPASATLAQGWLDYASLARAVGELTALGFSIALLAFALNHLVTRLAEQRRTESREASIGSNAAAPAVSVAVQRIHDATASELDDDARVPGFAPVLSLTEAQVERRRAERQRQEHRTALKGA
jgi:hypothetical protein